MPYERLSMEKLGLLMNKILDPHRMTFNERVTLSESGRDPDGGSLEKLHESANPEDMIAFGEVIQKIISTLEAEKPEGYVNRIGLWSIRGLELYKSLSDEFNPKTAMDDPGTAARQNSIAGEMALNLGKIADSTKRVDKAYNYYNEAFKHFKKSAEQYEEKKLFENAYIEYVKASSMVDWIMEHIREDKRDVAIVQAASLHVSAARSAYAYSATLTGDRSKAFDAGRKNMESARKHISELWSIGRANKVDEVYKAYEKVRLELIDDPVVQNELRLLETGRIFLDRHRNTVDDIKPRK
ncbi:MAG: hypothetical protein ABIH11_02520 [Candidatus Altiarchaeota archaeon]